MGSYRKLSLTEISTLEKNGCRAEQWNALEVGDDFVAERVHNARFIGRVRIGRNDGTVVVDGISRQCGIYNALVINCQIGDNVLISNIGSSIHNYRIEENAVIENVDLLFSEEGSQFGNGVQVRVLNETGGREITLFSGLSSQIAYIEAIYKHDQVMQDRLKEIIEGCIREESQGSGVIEKGARIRSSGIIRNVRIGPYAEVHGALELQNGTLLSCSEDPAFIESGVIMKDFIAAEGARVDGGACLERTYVGQGVQAGDHLSAENALLFANSEALRSEVCSIFAGPYTVTHHASTLLIANMLSFFNGGSGTNQSNHMYKLGPVHQGIIERGCKTGSFAYLMMECHIGAFCVIIGKHMSNIDIPYFPFSYLLEEEGKSSLMPGISLLSIGIVRDDEKWPARDKRKGPVKRDCIIYDVFSPYTVEKMRRGRDILLDLYQKTPKDVDTVYTGGVQIKRLLLRKGAKYYRLAIDRYLLSVLLAFIEDSAKSADLWKDILNRVEGYTREEDLEDWVDMGGLILPRKRIYALLTEIREKHLTTVDELMRRIHLLYSRYREDERSYIFQAVEKEFGITISDLKPAELFPLIERWEDAAASLHALILENTKSEFGHVSRIGYGLDHETEREADFMAVRGSLQNNSVLKKFTAEKDRIYERARKVRQIVKRFA